jgi:hypothetical protein
LIFAPNEVPHHSACNSFIYLLFLFEKSPSKGSHSGIYY